MKKMSTLMFVILSIVLFATAGYCAKDSPEEHVKRFYLWYVDQRMKEDPLYNNTIEKFVDHCVVRNLRIFDKRWYFDADYFTKAQDMWDTWRKVLIVYTAMHVDKTTSIVPVSFKFAEDNEQQLVVFVQKHNNAYRITKVIDTFPYVASE